MKEYYHPKFIKQAYGDLTLLNIGDEEVISQICSSGLDSFYDDLLKQDVITEDIREHPDNVIEGMTNPERKKVERIKKIQSNIKLPKVPMKTVSKTNTSTSNVSVVKHKGGESKHRRHRRHRKSGGRRRPVINNYYYDDYEYDYPYYYPFFSYFYDDGYYYPRPTTYIDKTVYKNDNPSFFDTNGKYLIIAAIIIIAILVISKNL
jgi:hypothetical protein